MDVVRGHWPGVSLAHCRYPPWEAGDSPQQAEPGSIAIGYNGQKGVVIQKAGGRVVTRDMRRGGIRLNGPEPEHWLRTSSPADVLEVTADRPLRHAIADELGVPFHADLDASYDWEDQQAWAILSRLRASVRGHLTLTDIERDHLVRRLYERTYQVRFSGIAVDRAASDRGLDPRRLRRVSDYVEDHIGRELTIHALAGAAAFSPYHFARSFRRATGLAPHQFVTLRRIERARALLLETDRSIADIATALGFVNRGHFRRLFIAQVGTHPSALRAQAKRE